MTEVKEYQNTHIDINQCVGLMKSFIWTQDKAEIKNVSIKLIELKEKLIKSNEPDNIARSAIISYVLNCSNNSLNFKTKKAKDLVKELIDNCFIKDVIRKSIKDINDKFKEPSPFRTMISFRKEIKQQKKHLELFFKIMMINQNINDIIKI